MSRYWTIVKWATEHWPGPIWEDIAASVATNNGDRVTSFVVGVSTTTTTVHRLEITFVRGILSVNGDQMSFKRSPGFNVTSFRPTLMTSLRPPFDESTYEQSVAAEMYGLFTTKTSLCFGLNFAPLCLIAFFLIRKDRGIVYNSSHFLSPSLALSPRPLMFTLTVAHNKLVTKDIRRRYQRHDRHNKLETIDWSFISYMHDRAIRTV